MRSRAELRSTIETVLRGLSIGLLAWMLWLSLAKGRVDEIVSAASSNLPSALRDWSVAGVTPDRISAGFAESPTPTQRDWLDALRRAGSEVRWNGDLPAVAIEVNPVASPRGGFNVFAASSDRSEVRLEDEIGPLDTAKTGSGGVRFTIPALSGVVEASSGGTIARAVASDSVRIGRVLVFGSAGWEAKFVVAALEEDGWKVDAQMYVAPGVTVNQGSIGAIDTARYSAVVVLDASAAAHASDIVRYSAAGGGVILAGAGASVEGLSALRAGTPGRTEPAPVVGSEPGATTLRSLAVTPIAGMRGDAIPLDRHNGLVTAAARRYSAGRVIQHGYSDTWRWRMSGGDESLRDHRAWWSNAVAGVAYAPRMSKQVAGSVDDAPIAHLVETLGPPSSALSPSLATTAGSVSLWLLFAILSLSLLTEWASRRLRGAR